MWSFNILSSSVIPLFSLLPGTPMNICLNCPAHISELRTEEVPGIGSLGSDSHLPVVIILDQGSKGLSEAHSYEVLIKIEGG